MFDRKTYNKNYRATHKRHSLSEQQKQHKKEYMQNYYQTHKQKWDKIIKWKKDNPEYMRNWRTNNKEGIKAYFEEWLKTHKEQIRELWAKHTSKRRNLGFIYLNEQFEGAVRHHINKEYIVWVPKELHRSVYHNVWTGQGMTEINNKVFEWLLTT